MGLIIIFIHYLCSTSYRCINIYCINYYYSDRANSDFDAKSITYCAHYTDNFTLASGETKVLHICVSGLEGNTLLSVYVSGSNPISYLAQLFVVGFSRAGNVDDIYELVKNVYSSELAFNSVQIGINYAKIDNF